MHRIGRTARAGQQGHAVSLVCVDEHKLLTDIERLLRLKIGKKVIAGFEPDPRIKAELITMGRALAGANNQDFASLTRNTMKLIRCPWSSAIARSACCFNIST